jgi:preprotein translocase subunit Sec63
MRKSERRIRDELFALFRIRRSVGKLLTKYQIIKSTTTLHGLITVACAARTLGKQTGACNQQQQKNSALGMNVAHGVYKIASAMLVHDLKIHWDNFAQSCLILSSNCTIKSKSVQGSLIKEVPSQQKR